MVVDFGVKLTSANFSTFYKRHYKKSFSNEVLNFDLSNLEWISIELATFWFAWMSELNVKSVQYSVQLPRRAQDQAINNRRRKCLNHLIHQWNLLANLQGGQIFDGGLTSETLVVLPNPFVCVPAIPYNSQTFDSSFDDLFKNELKNFSDHAKQVLSSHSNLNYFDNQYLSYSILKEFFSNVCQHAYPDNDLGKAFISIKINSKIPDSFSKAVIEGSLRSRQIERAENEQPFFVDEKSHLRNDDFIELCFLDLGLGISETLKEKYMSEDVSKLQEELHKDHLNQNLDCRVLEYAFLLFTSKFELGRHFEVHNYIPRGLFIIKEIVSRNKGMLIARSGNGKIVFDFSKSDKLETSIRYANDVSVNSNFKGTFISIVLPTRSKGKKTKLTSQNRKDVIREIDAINLLYFAVESKRRAQGSELEQQRMMYENFFSHLAKRMKAQIGKHKLMIIDFAGIEMKNNDLVNKLIYFFAFCPVVTERNQLCLINVLDRGLNESLVFSELQHLRNRGFYPKPIPVIHPNLDVSWVGVRDLILGQELTKAWKRNDSLYESGRNSELLEGNVIEFRSVDERQTEVVFTIPDFGEVCTILKNEISKFITAEIANKGIQFPSLMNSEHNYNNVQQQKSDQNNRSRAFQTANGKFQERYFSFSEKMYVREYRRGLACYLTTFLFLEGTRIENFSRVKILTVTLSSQLLGREVADILENFHSDGNHVEMIPLSNYNSFSTEEPFHEIRIGDKIIVVSDVISTGNLSYNLYYAINSRGAQVAAILSILDNRLKDERENTNEVPIIGLLNLNIRKFDKNPYPDTTPVRINPILNSPTTMSRVKSGEDHILLKPTDFLRSLASAEMLLVGQFKLNTVYHYYYLATSQMFQSDKLNGYKLISSILDKFFLRLAEKSEGEVGIDFVFYPFFSSISHLIEDIKPLLRKHINNFDFELLPVPRIMTPKGWRFSFPPKHMNLITETGEKSALVLDDGSCTGDTLMQLIDTISFLKLSEIFVLVLFARLEDFQREFFTKISSIEVAGKPVKIHIYFGTQFHIPVYQKIATPGHAEMEKIRAMKSYYELNSIDLPGFVSNFIDFRVKQLETFQTPSLKTQTVEISDVEKIEMFLVRDMLGRYDSYRLFKEDEPGSDSPNPVNETLFVDNRRNFRTLASVLLLEPQLIETATRISPEILTRLILHFEQEFDLLHKSKEENSFEELYFFLRCIVMISPGKLRDKMFLYKVLFCIDRFYNDAKDEKSNSEADIICGLLAFNFLESLVETEKKSFPDNYYATRNLIRNVWQEMSELSQVKDSGLQQSKSHELKFSHKVFRLLYVTIIPKIGISTSGSITPFVKVQGYYSKLTIEGINHKYVTDYNNFEKLGESLSGFINVGSSEQERREFVKDFKKYKNEVFDSVLNNLCIVLERLSSYPRLTSQYAILQWKDRIDYLKNQVVENLGDEFIRTKPADDVLFRLKSWFGKFTNDILSPTSPLLRFVLDADSDILHIWKETIQEYSDTYPDASKLELILVGEVPLPRLRIHQYILKLIFLHILSNKREYAPNAKCEYKASIERRNGNMCVVLHFKQYASFIKDVNGNRGLSDIRYMLGVYGGNYNHIDRENYTFELVFPLIVLNNE